MATCSKVSPKVGSAPQPPGEVMNAARRGGSVPWMHVESPAQRFAMAKAVSGSSVPARHKAASKASPAPPVASLTRSPKETPSPKVTAALPASLSDRPRGGAARAGIGGGEERGADEEGAKGVDGVREVHVAVVVRVTGVLTGDLGRSEEDEGKQEQGVGYVCRAAEIDIAANKQFGRQVFERVVENGLSSGRAQADVDYPRRDCRRNDSGQLRFIDDGNGNFCLTEGNGDTIARSRKLVADHNERFATP